MANREALALLVDVGEGMACDGRMLRAASLLEALLKQKLLFAPSDEVAIVLFGTEGTQNELNEQGGDYEHVTVFQPFDTLRLSTLRDLRPRRLDADDEEQHEHEHEHELKREQPRDNRALVLPSVLTPSLCEGDFIDAMMVAMDLIKRRTQGKRTRRRLVLITAAASSCTVDDNDVCALVNLIDQECIDLSVAGIDFDGDRDDDDIGRMQAATDAMGTRGDVAHAKKLKRANEQTLRHIVRQGKGIVWNEAEAHAAIELSMMKETRGTASFRGALQVGPTFSIQVHCFALLKPVTFPQLMKESQVAPRDTQQGCCSCTVYRRKREPRRNHESDNARENDKARISGDNMHKVFGDQHNKFAVMCDGKTGDTEVAAEQRINAYPYGSFLTPFSAADEVAAKPDLTPGLHCLGLVPSTAVRREWLMGATQVMVAEPDNQRAQVALSAFVKGLHEEKRFMVARLVKSMRSAQALLVLLRPGALHPRARGTGPNSRPQSTTVDCFFVDELPFADDVRDTHFGSFGCPNVCDIKLESTALDSECDEAHDQLRCPATSTSSSATAAVCAHEPSRAQQRTADILVERMQLSEGHPQAANALPRNPSVALHMERVYQKAIALRPQDGLGSGTLATAAVAQSQAGAVTGTSSIDNVANVSLAPGLADGIRASLEQSAEILCHAGPALDDFAAAFSFKAGRNYRKKAGHWTDAQPSKRSKLSLTQSSNATCPVTATGDAKSISAEGSHTSAAVAGHSDADATNIAADSSIGGRGGGLAADAPVSSLKGSTHDIPFPQPATACRTASLMHMQDLECFEDKSGNSRRGGGRAVAAGDGLGHDNSNNEPLGDNVSSTPNDISFGSLSSTSTSAQAPKLEPVPVPAATAAKQTMRMAESSSDTDDSVTDLI